MGAEYFLDAERKIESEGAGVEIELLADVGKALPLPVRSQAEGLELLLDEWIDVRQELDDGRKPMNGGDSALSSARNPIALLPRESSRLSFLTVFSGVGSGRAGYEYLVFHAIMSGLAVVRHSYFASFSISSAALDS